MQRLSVVGLSLRLPNLRPLVAAPRRCAKCAAVRSSGLAQSKRARRTILRALAAHQERERDYRRNCNGAGSGSCDSQGAFVGASAARVFGATILFASM